MTLKEAARLIEAGLLTARHSDCPADQLVEATSFLPRSASLRQRAWHVVRDQTSIPLCATCNAAPVRWTTSRAAPRYTRHCSNACRANDPMVEAKRAATSIERHGHTGRLDDPRVRQRVTETCQDRYGAATPLESEHLGPRVRQAVDVERRGQRIAQAMGEMSPEKRAAMIARRRRTSRSGWLAHRHQAALDLGYTPAWSPEDLSIDSTTEVSFYHGACGTTFTQRMVDGQPPRCPTCFPLRGTAFQEKEIADVFCQHFPREGEVLVNTRSIIPPLEVDVAVPTHKVAIEFNGIWWHSEAGSGGRCDRHYHLNKTLAAQKAGWRLIHVFADTWESRRAAVESMLRATVGIFTKRRTHARQLSVVSVDVQHAREFFERSHIQGGAVIGRSSVSYGLQDQNGDLLAVMSFGPSRYSRNAEWELLRMASALDTQVVGGMSRLFKTFVRHHAPSSIVSYADRAMFTGATYQQLGFVHSHDTPPGYWYVNTRQGSRVRESRLKYQKHKLSKLLEAYDASLSEADNMAANGFTRIWDCGQSVWMWRSDR